MKPRVSNSKQKSDNWILVRGARQLLTLHGRTGARRGSQLADLGLIPDGSVLLRDGVIEEVGPTRRVENMARARNCREVDAAGCLVMPAFVDPHAALVPVPGRSHGEHSRSINSIPATRLEAEADELLQVMARHGTATVGALSGNGCDDAGELKILRAHHALHRKPLDIVSIFFSNSADQPNAQNDLLDCVVHRKLAQIAAIQCGFGATEPHVSEAFLSSARSQGIAARLELLAERPIELVEIALNLAALSVCAPGAYLSSEIELLSRSSTVAVLLPHLLSRLGSDGTARRLIDSGALIALGSGLNPQSGATASMQTVLQLACEHLGLSVPEAICAATLNAAWALGVGPETGSLEHGKRADLILLNASDYREIPMLYGTNLVCTMIKRGVLLFEEEFPSWPTRS